MLGRWITHVQTCKNIGSDFVPPRLRDHTNGKIAIRELLILAAPATTNDPVGSELAHARSETDRVALVWGQAA
jgi:hypothetical protein